jgi:uncharacterized protein (TIGR00255 family)
MTGFGAGEERLGAGVVRVELRAVNHRHLDIRVRLPPELADHAHSVEELIRARAGRGRIEASVRWDGGQATQRSLDVTRVRALYTQLLELRDELAPGEPVPLTALLSVPGIMSSEVAAAGETTEQAIKRATQHALAVLMEMRRREGAALARDLHARLGELRSHTSAVAAQRPAVIEAARERLIKRVEKLLEGTEVQVDPARLTQEIAWFAERSDIAEELTRLDSHLKEFEHTLGAGAESIGKKLDFLVQELGREVNTVGSKANDAGIAHRVVEMKAELERIREQVQNLL